MPQALTQQLIAAAGVSDKERRHGYLSNVYGPILANRRIRSVLELGVWRGDSLRMWMAAFPHARVRGIDQSPNDYAKGLEVIYDDAYTEACAAQIAPVSVDLVVEDGSHTLGTQLAAFDLYWEKVAFGGLMVIEDIGSEAAALELQARVWGRPHELFDLSHKYAEDSRALVIWK